MIIENLEMIDVFLVNSYHVLEHKCCIREDCWQFGSSVTAVSRGFFMACACKYGK